MGVDECGNDASRGSLGVDEEAEESLRGHAEVEKFCDCLGWGSLRVVPRFTVVFGILVWVLLGLAVVDR